MIIRYRHTFRSRILRLMIKQYPISPGNYEEARLRFIDLELKFEIGRSYHSSAGLDLRLTATATISRSTKVFIVEGRCNPILWTEATLASSA